MKYGISRLSLAWCWCICLLLSQPLLAADAAGDIRQRLAPLLQQQPATLTLDGANISLGVAKFYEDGNFQPLWNDSRRLAALVESLQTLAGDGLNTEDYSLSALQKYQARLQARDMPSAEQTADADILATHAYLRALLHLFHGKTDPASLDPRWNFSLRDADPESGLKQALASARQGDIRQIFQQARPQHPSYEKMRTALAALRAQEAKGGWVPVPSGGTLKPGMTDARVAVLRERLQQAGLPLAATERPDFYDDKLLAAVKLFQTDQYLVPDGAVGPGTLRVLNVPVASRIQQLRVNMERARWLLHGINSDFVLVDVAGYRIAYVRDGKVIWKSRVQVGKPYRSTPIFQSKVTYLTFNPTWTVPPTILREDTLPKVRKDLGYLQKNRLRVLDAGGREIPAASVDWNRPGNITLRQDAGPGNALGRMVVRFPNNYSVYLHDTPHQGLFTENQRAFSSGCIRVERILELAKLLLNDDAKWSAANIETELATGKTQNISLKKTVPILLAYWTVEIADDGQPAFRPDIYDRDAAVVKALDSKPAS